MQDESHEFSFKDLFVPFTTIKAIHWIIVIGVVVYLNGLFNGFVADDLPLIIFNPVVHSLSNIPSLFHESTYYTSSQDALSGIYYKPIMLSVFTMLYSLFGLQAFFYHTLQLFLHVINGILVFFLFRKFFEKPLSFFLSIIFLIHPINSESVLYISAIQENLFFLFGMLSLLLLTYKSTSRFTSFVLPLFLLLSLLSKETGILFFLIDILYVLLYLRNNRIKKIVLLVCPILAYLVLRFSAMGLKIHNVKANPIMTIDLLHRILNIPSLIDFYLIRFLFPKDLAMSYNEVIQKVTFSNFYIHLAVIAVLLAITCFFGIVIWKKKRANSIAYTFFALWFVMGMGLHLQLIPLDQSAAERWFYFPMVGLLGMIGIGISQIKFTKDVVKRIFLTIAITIVIALGVRSFIRSFDWRNGMILYTHDLKIYKDDYLMHGNLGYELFQIGDLQQAKQELKTSITLFPSVTNYNNYCLIQYIIGQKNSDQQEKSQAITCYKQMLPLFHYQPAIYEKLIDLLLRENNTHSAENYIRGALTQYPQRALLWYYLAEIQLKKNDKTAALSAIQKAYSLQPTDANIYQLYNQLIQQSN